MEGRSHVSVTEQALVRWARRNFQQLGLRARAALCQLPLVASVLAAPLAMPAEWTRAGERPLFLAGLLLLVAATAACFAIPWDSLSPNALLAVPIQDFVAIGLLNQGSADGLRGLGALSIIPVIWIAASMPSTRVALALSLAGPVFIALPAMIEALVGFRSTGLGDALLLPPLLLTVAVAVRAARAGLTIQERQLRAQQARLQKLLVESQSTERLLTTLLDAVNVGIVAVGPDARPVRYNRRFRELAAESGWSMPGVEENASAGLDLYARDRRTPLAPEQLPLRRAAAGERISDEIVWLGRGSDSRALSVVARPVEGPEGGAVISFGDVTALAGAVEDKAELVRTVAHEFRSPLTAVLGNLDLVLESAVLAPEDRWRLDVAQRSAERLIELAADLAVSSPDTLAVRLEAAELCAVLTARADAARLSAAAAGVQLDADLQEPLWVRADPLRVGQAVDNLLSNAIKYSPDGGTVRLRAAQQDGWVTVEVSDRGMGIAAGEQERVFERFFRTAEARRSEIPGVGLGLALTQWIAERHGGRLEVESEPGSGSVFTLLLPVHGPGLA